jgi:DNA-binding transcriptional ArsR family regulator
MSFRSAPVPALRDPRALRALAHPARLAILERLASDGPATATECAEVTGQSPSACSYHLRALARWGLVEESAGNDRRERRWAATGPFTIGDHDGPRRADVAAAEHVLTEQILDRASSRVVEWMDRLDEEPREWRDAGRVSTTNLLVTAGELAGLLDEIDRLVAPYRTSARRDDAPGDARRVHLHLSAVPRTT